METDNSTAGIYSEIYKTLASDESLFPVLPETTMRVREMLQDQNCRLSNVATLLKADPALTALIMRVANSARFMSVFAPKDLEAALKRIGLGTAAELVTAFSIRSGFDAPTGKLKTLLLESYRESTNIAVLSYFLASKASKLNPAKAMLAGLIQDISLPPILRCLSERPEIFDNTRRRNEAIDHLAPMISVLILKKWGFNKAMIEAVRSRKDWMRDPHKKPDLGDIILIARIHSVIGSPQFREYPTMTEIPAFGKFSLGEFTPDQSLALLADAKEEIAELNQLLA